MNLDSNKKVYLSGIGGIGVSALARYFLDLGKQVHGSDAAASEITKDLESKGVVINYSQIDENISDDIDLFIYSSAVPESNPERQKVKELDIKELSYNEFLGWLSKQYKTIAVSGTNGKTTTTAMISEVLINADLDPNVIIGSNSPSLNGNYRKGKDWFVLEACEYKEHFLNLLPKIIVLTNIEEDHLDYFRDLNHIIQTFQKFINKLTNPDNILVINADDDNSKQLILSDCEKITYGFKEDADVTATNLRIENSKQKFSVKFNGNDLGEFELKIPGEFNVSNALATIALALKLNINLADIKKALADFSGTWRRFEIIKKEPIIISDYAHHPTAVKATRKAIDDFHAEKKKIIVFQPHQHNRTKKLYNEFVQSLLPQNKNETIIINEIFDVRGREEKNDQAVSSKDLVESINKQKNPELKDVIYSSDLENTLDLIKKNADKDSVILIMGAGDIYEIVNKI